MVHDAVMICVEEQDIERLKYIFVDCLDVDPTFEKYKDDYKYCMNNSVLGLFEKHMELTPMRKEKDSWDISYWNSIKMDLIENFSIKRFEHMREVARVVHAEKIERLLREREQKSIEETRQKEIQKQRAEEYKRQQQEALNKSTEEKPSVIQKRQLEEARRRLELENKKTEEERIRNQQNQHAQSRVNLQANQEVDRGKKEVGIVVVVLIAAIILIALLIIR